MWVGHDLLADLPPLDREGPWAMRLNKDGTDSDADGSASTGRIHRVLVTTDVVSKASFREVGFPVHGQASQAALRPSPHVPGPIPKQAVRRGRTLCQAPGAGGGGGGEGGKEGGETPIRMQT